MKDIEPLSSQTIQKYLPDRKICVKFSDTTTTMSYLDTSKNETCPNSHKCQKYFCRKDDEPCPVVDVWFDNVVDSENYDGLATYDDVILIFYYRM